LPGCPAYRKAPVVASKILVVYRSSADWLCFWLRACSQKGELELEFTAWLMKK